MERLFLGGWRDTEQMVDVRAATSAPSAYRLAMIFGFTWRQVAGIVLVAATVGFVFFMAWAAQPGFMGPMPLRLVG